jgi:hypothetical protein
MRCSHLISPSARDTQRRRNADRSPEKLLARVAKTIHEQPNRVKYVMNGFVIAVGCYVKPLHKLAVDTAKKIGKVDVDLVGDCKIPSAPDKIKQVAARRAIGKKRKSAKC